MLVWRMETSDDLFLVFQPFHFLVPGDLPSPLVSMTLLLQAFSNGYILPPSPAFSRFTWNLLLIVPRALLVIFRIKRANTLTQKYLVFAQAAQILWEFVGL